MDLVPASAQHNSSRSKSMLSELGSFTADPFRKTERPVPSAFAHSNFGDSRFQSDQNTFLYQVNKQFKYYLIFITYISFTDKVLKVNGI